MIETYNILDSYVYFRKEALKVRLQEIFQVIKKLPRIPEDISIVDNKGNLRHYERLPKRIIEKLEVQYNITPEPSIKEVTYLEIVNGYIKYLVNKVMEGHDVKLGARLGIVGVRGTRVKPTIDDTGRIRGIAPSWSKTRASWIEKATELGITVKEYINTVPKHERKLIFCFNEHSDFIRYKIVWYKKNVVVKNKTIYSLRFNRSVQRKLSNLINEGKEYLVNIK